MNEKCLPCELHKVNRKTLKELVLPLIIEYDHDIALYADKTDPKVEANFHDESGDLYNWFWDEFSKLGEVYVDVTFDRSDAADFARKIEDGMYEFFIYRETVYYRKINLL